MFGWQESIRKFGIDLFIFFFSIFLIQFGKKVFFIFYFFNLIAYMSFLIIFYKPRRCEVCELCTLLTT